MPNEDKYFEDLLDDVFSTEEDDSEEDVLETENVEEDPEEDEEESKNVNDEEESKNANDEELSEEEKREKNKNAEEARKRRAKEAKEKEEADRKAEENAKKEEREKNNINKLGEELADFVKKYPNVDLGKLDTDVNFKKFIDGKLLGKKDFTDLYEDYIDLISNVSDSEEVKLRHQIKNEASSGSQRSRGENVEDVYSEEDFNKLVEKMPTMTQKEIDKVWNKFQKSLNFYKKK